MNSNDFWNRGTPGYSPLPLDQTDEAQVESDEMLTVVPVGEDPLCRILLRVGRRNHYDLSICLEPLDRELSRMAYH